MVDDAIVVIENISRYREQGMAPFEAAVRGAREIGFTVVSISISLVAVFIPILLMGGIVGRLFREFAVTLSTAVVVSMVVSLTTTPMMCAKLLRPEADEPHGKFYRSSQRIFDGALAGYSVGLSWVLRHSRLTLAIALATLGLSVYLFSVIPKGFFPQQDTGRLMGAIQADQDTSFQSMRDRLTQFVGIIKTDPSVDHVIGFAGGNAGSTNTARMFIALKPLGPRKLSADQVIARLAKKNLSCPRCDALSPGRAGSADRRPLEQRALSVHLAGIRLAGTEPMGAAAAPEDARSADLDRRQ